jgi:hypothetical protein
LSFLSTLFDGRVSLAGCDGCVTAGGGELCTGALLVGGATCVSVERVTGRSFTTGEGVGRGVITGRGTSCERFGAWRVGRSIVVRSTVVLSGVDGDVVTGGGVRSTRDGSFTGEEIAGVLDDVLVIVDGGCGTRDGVASGVFTTA